MTETLSIKVPKETKVRLKALAKARKTRPSALLREALDNLLEKGRLSSRPSLYDLTKDIIDNCGSGPGDLSTNKKHMEGYGE